jgi:1,4-alpha-glucan branching enzyme
MLANSLATALPPVPILAPKRASVDLLVKKRATLGASLMLIAPGIVPILAVPAAAPQDSPSFGPVDPLQNWEQAEHEQCVLAACRDLIRLRCNAGGNTRGLAGEHIDIYHVDQPAQVVGIHQWHTGGAGDSVIILANLAALEQKKYRVGLPAPGTWHVRFNSDWIGYDPAFETAAGGEVAAESVAADNMPFSGLLCIPASALMILSQSRAEKQGTDVVPIRGDFVHVAAPGPA